MLDFNKTLLGFLLLLLIQNLTAQTEIFLPEMKDKATIENEKRNSRLTGDLKIAQANVERVKLGKPAQHLNKAVRIEKDRIYVDLIAKSDLQKLENQLAEIDFEMVASYGKMISGWIYIDELEELNKLSQLQYARPSYTPARFIGSVDSQGDATQYSATARANYGLDGTGLKVGVLSDSYNTLNGEAAGIASGDIPGPGNPNGYTTPVTVLEEYTSTGSDEARGMIEIIHDVAPGAEIFTHTAFLGEASFAQGIIDLRNAGCDVIVDDVGYFAEPFFQEGIIAQAVNQVVDDGAVYFSAAGNSGRKSYESSFENSGFLFSGKPLHDFDPGVGISYVQELTVPNGVSLSITLQWDDPFGSLPGSVGSADTDLDIYAYNATLSALLTSGTTNNIATGDPLEIINYTNTTGTSQVVNVLIINYTGPTPSLLKYQCWTSSVDIQYDTESSPMVPHANSRQGIACGASAWFNNPGNGVSPGIINSFSSAGGTPMLFDSVGNSITPIIRDKPEIVGPDGANTTFFGSDIPQDADSYPNFYGTSAAAPHVAGAALLMLEAGATNKAEVLTALIATAEDMDDPTTAGMDAGFDMGTGNGMVNINAAVANIMALLPVELTDFRIQAIGDRQGLLSWSTLSEFNNESFIIQSRRDDTGFTTIAEVSGKGNSNELTNYELMTEHLNPGMNYFKLLQKDRDGRLTEHKIVNLEIKPAQTNVWSFQDFEKQMVAVESKKDMEYSIQVYNANGKQIFNIEDRVAAGERQVTEWLIDNWTGGVYFYTVNENGDQSKSFHTGKFRLLKN